MEAVAAQLNSAAAQVVAEGASLYTFYGWLLVILGIVFGVTTIIAIYSIRDRGKEGVSKDEPLIALLFGVGTIMALVFGVRFLIAPSFHATLKLLSQIGS